MAKREPKVWIEQGVIMKLRPAMDDGYRRVKKLFRKYGLDLYGLSGGEGDHQMDSLHYHGYAIDIRKAKGITKRMLQKALGKDFDVVEYSWGWHLEYDPK